ncbi:unnamed protein product [Rotaria sp. Silwood1]|nr:unnamed protein product [Rotaria sp. Silwood1]CAF1639285.1 unnamed protein product [Rotaria sp. Silwood1]CAF5030854.1 unnamed protein product [Rotaria sp. Silwood1]
MVVLYKTTEQWTLAMETYEKIWTNSHERDQTGEVEVFVKILGHTENNSNAHHLTDKNRKFLGGKTISRFLDKHQKHNVLYAYAELADHHLKYNSLDHAFLYYQEVLQCELKIDSHLILRCLYGIGNIYEMRKEYSSAIEWLKKGIDYSIKDTSDIGMGLIDIYKKSLSIFNEKLNDTYSSIIYMTEIINNLIGNTDSIEKRNDLIAKVYKTTIQFYHYHDKTQIESICNHIHQVLEKIKIHDQGWKKWLCIGSTCIWEIFYEDYHNCNPIIDENNIIYLKLYQKIFAILSKNTSNKLQTEINRCEKFLNHLEYSMLDFQSFVIQ